MNNDTIGIKLVDKTISAKGIKIVRNLTGSSISEIKAKVQNDNMLYECDSVDDDGLNLIIKIYEELYKAGISCIVFEMGSESKIEYLYNLRQTYEEISEESERYCFSDDEDE